MVRFIYALTVGERIQRKTYPYIEGLPEVFFWKMCHIECRTYEIASGGHCGMTKREVLYTSEPVCCQLVQYWHEPSTEQGHEDGHSDGN